MSPACPAVTRSRASGPGRVVRVESLLVEGERRQGPGGAAQARAGQQHQQQQFDERERHQDPEPGTTKRPIGPNAAPGSAAGGRRRRSPGASSSHAERPRRRYASRDAMKREKAAGSSSCSMPASQPVPARSPPSGGGAPTGSSSSRMCWAKGLSRELRGSSKRDSASRSCPGSTRTRRTPGAGFDRQFDRQGHLGAQRPGRKRAPALADHASRASRSPGSTMTRRPGAGGVGGDVRHQPGMGGQGRLAGSTRNRTGCRR